MQRLSAIPYITPSTATVQIQLPLSAGNFERSFWKFDSVIRFNQKVETACYALLALSGIGTVLYSVSVFLR